jgi:hypothetical protein
MRAMRDQRLKHRGHGGNMEDTEKNGKTSTAPFDFAQGKETQRT